MPHQWRDHGNAPDENERNEAAQVGTTRYETQPHRSLPDHPGPQGFVRPPKQSVIRRRHGIFTEIDPASLGFHDTSHSPSARPRSHTIACMHALVASS